MVSQLIEMPPLSVEVRGNIVYFDHGTHKFAQSVECAQRTVAMVQHAIRDWQDAQTGRITRLHKKAKRKGKRKRAH